MWRAARWWSQQLAVTVLSVQRQWMLHASSRRLSRSTTVQTPFRQPWQRRRQRPTRCWALTCAAQCPAAWRRCYARLVQEHAGLLHETTRRITSLLRTTSRTLSLQRCTPDHSTTSCPCRGRLAISLGVCLLNIVTTIFSLSSPSLCVTCYILYSLIARISRSLVNSNIS